MVHRARRPRRPLGGDRTSIAGHAQRCGRYGLTIPAGSLWQDRAEICIPVSSWISLYYSSRGREAYCGHGQTPACELMTEGMRNQDTTVRV